MKKVIIYHFTLAMLCTVFYADSKKYDPKRLQLLAIQNTVLKLIGQHNDTFQDKVPVIGGDGHCGENFFCNAEKSLKLTNLTCLHRLESQLKTYNNMTQCNYGVFNGSEDQEKIIDLLNHIENCTEIALRHRSHGHQFTTEM